MLKVVLVRHSMTGGNKLKRYIGITDEPLCEEGRKLLLGREYPKVEALYVSPMKRCIETASIIYPDFQACVIDDFREIDFGDFENKNYKELEGNPDYQKWIDSGGKLGFPGGEPQEEFERRALSAFDEATKQAVAAGYETVAIVIHGGTIMTIMNHLFPSDDYYKYMVKNGEGYIICLDTEEGKPVSMTPIFDHNQEK
ncbi:MAG: histidine phosphatase family protein [Lachnospiraceae bacterium]|nr:histidine phosphatase family protein [Lachnospiraceae bacterium]